MTTNTDRERKLREYDALEDAIEASAFEQTWRLADWLADNVPNDQGARNDLETAVSKLTLKDLAERRGRTVQHLRYLRRVAEVTRPDRRPDVALRTYRAALERNGWDLAAANASLGEKPRLRDYERMESFEATRRQVEQLPPERKRELFTELAENPEVTSDPATRTRATEGIHRGRRASAPPLNEPANSVGDELADIRAAFDRDNLPSIVAEHARDLIRVLENVPEWMARFGDRRLTPDGDTLGYLMAVTLSEESDRVAQAFEIAKGDIGSEAEAFLADQSERG